MADFWLLVAKQSSRYELGMQQGDVIDFCPVNTKLPDHIRAQYIIVPVTGVTEADVEILKKPLWNTGEDSISLTGNEATVTGKRKHQIRFIEAAAAMTGWDAEKATDTHVIYQPFLDKNIKVAIKSVNFVRNKYTDTYRKVFS